MAASDLGKVDADIGIARANGRARQHHRRWVLPGQRPSQRACWLPTCEAAPSDAGH